MKKILIPLLSILFVVQTSHAECIPPVEYIKFAGRVAQPEANGQVSLGMYSRISPDGKYVLRSVSGSGLGKVVLLKVEQDSNKKVITAQTTNMENEAFPVQGSWRYLVDTNGDHYVTKELLEKGKTAKKAFTGGVKGFYTAAAESSETENSVQVFSFAGPTTSDTDKPMELSASIITLEKNADGKLVKKSDRQVKDLCQNLKGSRMFTLPMISSDAKEFTAVPSSVKSGTPTTRIYKLDGSNCEQIDDLGFVTPKAIFGFERNKVPAPIIFTGSTTVDGETKIKYIYSENVPDPENPKKTIVKKYDPPKEFPYVEKVAVSGLLYYDRELKKIFQISDPHRSIQHDSFPGLTKDGRVMVAAHWNEVFKREKEFEEKQCDKDQPTQCTKVKVKRWVNVTEEQAGYVVFDPFQSPFYKNLPQNKRKCITKEEVTAVEHEYDQKLGFTSAQPSTPAADQPSVRTNQ